MDIKSYRDLIVWQKAMELVVICYRLTDKLPKTETHGLVGSIQRSATYIPAYIADGHSRNNINDYIGRLSLALGSLSMLETHLLAVEMLSFLPMNEIQPALDLCTEVGKMLNKLMSTLRGGRH